MKAVGIEIQCLSCAESADTEIAKITRLQLRALIKKKPECRFVFFVEDPAQHQLYTEFLYAPNVTLDGVLNVRQYRLDLFHITDPLTVLPRRISPFALAPGEFPTSISISELTPLVPDQSFLSRLSNLDRQEYCSRLDSIAAGAYFILCGSEQIWREARSLAGVTAKRLCVVDLPSPSAWGDERCFERSADSLVEAWEQCLSISVDRPSAALDPTAILL